MSVHPTMQHLSRGFAVAGSIIASLAVTGVASATEPSVTRVDGNPNCSTIGSGYRQLKIDPVPQGRHSFGDGVLSGTIVVRGLYFDWTADQGVDAVIVKGGPNASIYRAAGEVTSGTGLHAPINPANGQPYGLSHITFCYDTGKPSPPPPPGPCQPGGPTTMPDGQPCNPPQPPPPGACQPGGPTTMPSGEPCVKAGTGNPVPVTTTVPGRPASPAQGGVLGERAKSPRKRVRASARMSGPRRCVSRPYTQVVRGKGIKRVTFYVNGKKVRTLSGRRSSYKLRIDPRAYRSGVMRVRARVEYVAASRKRTQTFRMTVLRCVADQVAGQRVRFAG